MAPPWFLPTSWASKSNANDAAINSPAPGANHTPNLTLDQLLRHGAAAGARRARTPFEIDQWHHLVVTCDPRFGGSISFYVDGKKDSQQALGLGVALDLESFRIGAWSGWEKNPKAGFYGHLDEFRIYRGTLTDR